MGFVLDILRQWRVDINLLHQKNILEELRR
jgi:hypothetical protein